MIQYYDEQKAKRYVRRYKNIIKLLREVEGEEYIPIFEEHIRRVKSNTVYLTWEEVNDSEIHSTLYDHDVRIKLHYSDNYNFVLRIYCDDLFVSEVKTMRGAEKSLRYHINFFLEEYGERGKQGYE